MALAASYPGVIRRLALVAAVTQPEARLHEPSFQSQKAFYGPLHGATWAMLGLLSRFSPRSVARRSLAIFSRHSPEDTLRHLSAEDITHIARFNRGRSSRAGASNDMTHMVGPELLQVLRLLTLVAYSREDRAVPFSHAEWAIQHISGSVLCESGFTGYLYRIGPDYRRISRALVEFLIED